MNSCSKNGCNAPDVGCSFGELDLSDCDYWSSDAYPEKEEFINKESEVRLPWTGLALGLTDVEFISGCSKPIVVGIVGAENAGKTSLLAAWYLLISKGLSTKIQRRFAGSYSLAGWESISDGLRWEPGQPPCFPSHTPSSSRRSPGLLHITFQNQATGNAQEYLFADAPGEWFGKWALNSESTEAEGARWLAKNADMFLLMADRDALSGKSKGRARSEFKRLVQRLGGELNGRPIALVWTKGDIVEDETMVNSIRDSTYSVIPEAHEFQIQVLPNSENETPESGLLELLSWVVEQESLKVKLPELQYTGQDPFFMFGCRNLM